MLEDLNKEKEPSAAAVKSVRATEDAGAGTAPGLSPEQRRWLANAANAMMAGQPVGLAGLPAAQGAAQQDALVPAGGSRAEAILPAPCTT